MRVLTHRLAGARVPVSFSSQRVSWIVKTVFRTEKVLKAGEVNVVFVDKKKISQLNRQFLHENGATDIIAFPIRHAGKSLSSIHKSGPWTKTFQGDGVAGDIFICGPVAHENARRFDENFRRELTRLIVHGTLHLLGYADEPAAARKKMWARQEPLVNKLAPS